MHQVSLFGRLQSKLGTGNSDCTWPTTAPSFHVVHPSRPSFVSTAHTRAPSQTSTSRGTVSGLFKLRRKSQPRDSGYASLASSIVESTTGGDFRNSTRCSWQTRNASSALFHDSVEHAEAFEPLWSEALFYSQPHCTSIRVSPYLPLETNRLVPKDILFSRTKMTSPDPSGRSPQNRSGSSPTQMLELKDAGTSTFPAISGTGASPSKSVFSDKSSMGMDSESVHHTNGATHDHAAKTGAGTSVRHLAGLVCNCHRTTGNRPPGLSGSSLTVVGDKLYVFGGHALETGMLSEHLFELDLVRRHWTKLCTTGSLPSPRYFHSMCALGDTKLVLFGGSMIAPAGVVASKNGTVPLSDIYLYDIESKEWTALSARNPPTPRYAHCATILPSAAVFSTPMASTSALHHNPPSAVPNQGKLGIEIDGRGAAEMIVVGGQYADEGYANSVDVFNFRSLTWTSRHNLALKKCGIYRSAVATLTGMPASTIGTSAPSDSQSNQKDDGSAAGIEVDWQSGGAALFYNNYNFVNPQVDLQIRKTDGSIVDLTPRSQETPPGLRFPSAGIINGHFILGGSYMRSESHEYMMWALNLRSLEWHRIGISSGVFERGSWNRGIAWPKRNAYIVVGDRSRDFDEDYAKRRVNFANFATVELEAFGLYDRPSGQTGDLSVTIPPIISHNPAGLDVGIAAMGFRELCDMEILTIDDKRIPINSYLIGKRWGAYFHGLMSEDLENKALESLSAEASFPHASKSNAARNRMSNMTITPSIQPSTSPRSPTLLNDEASSAQSLSSNTTVVGSRPLSLSGQQPVTRSRLLFLPHSQLTVQALVYFLYTSSLPPTSSRLCTTQVLCSLLQIARPYRIQGLLEATVERLHQILDGRNTASIFNAAATAAGGGNVVGPAGQVFPYREDADRGSIVRIRTPTSERHQGEIRRTIIEDDSESEGADSPDSSINSPDSSKAHTPAWAGDWSAVVGLQKRALRGLLEGKRMRERTKSEDSVPGMANGG